MRGPAGRGTAGGGGSDRSRGGGAARLGEGGRVMAGARAAGHVGWVVRGPLGARAGREGRWARGGVGQARVERRRAAAATRSSVAVRATRMCCAPAGP